MFSLPPLLPSTRATVQSLPRSLACATLISTGALVALSTWYPGHWQALLLLLPAIWSRVRERTSALAIWMGYYLAGARDIPVVSMRFFSGYGELTRPEGLVLGFLFWIAQACVLATPWAVLKPEPNAGAARYALCAAVATVLVTVPPLGIIGWLSPAYVSSTLFPGWKAPGLLLGVTAIACAASVSRGPPVRHVAALLAILSAVAHSVASTPLVPSRWVALDTHFGRFDQSSYALLYARTQQVQAITQRAFTAGATVVVLPEEIVGLWRPAVAYWWRNDIQAMAAAKRTLIIGLDLTVSATPFRYTDSAIIDGASHGRIDSRQPVPATLWRPGAAISAIRGDLMQPYITVAGKRVAFSICYEDLLWWPHWRMLLQSPDALVSLSNSWFDSDLALAHIQRQGIAAIARLSGTPLLRAVNR
ncbi:conjugal transfer protein TraB [Burkholderia pseudomallei]|uniref:conjugal transfer protein TraB n=1 Tax=Burkholderia pseudomallei TaxID=28450 RepID=UPI001AD71B06|nr:conjugal transfer protein TraB [Burkholderia pseudomallei]MBO7804345.1 conjugal transfer protein TraB [Burkholderia pseudomallei]